MKAEPLAISRDIKVTMADKHPPKSVGGSHWFDWPEKSIGHITCDCGAKYELIQHKMPFRDNDAVHCHACGKELKSWNGSVGYMLKPLTGSIADKHPKTTP